MTKGGYTKTFRFTSYLCYLFLERYGQKFVEMGNKLEIKFHKTDGIPLPVYEWTHKIRIHGNKRNYKYFVD